MIMVVSKEERGRLRFIPRAEESFGALHLEEGYFENEFGQWHISHLFPNQDIKRIKKVLKNGCG